jgi:hypothetical protein
MRRVVALLMLLGSVGALTGARAEPAAAPGEPLIPSAPLPLPHPAEPRGDLAPSTEPVPSTGAVTLPDLQRIPIFASLERLPVWRGRSGYGKDIYGFRFHDEGSDLSVGLGPTGTPDIPSGYIAGLLWRHGRFRIQGDVLTGTNRLGRAESSSLLTAYLRMSSDLTFLLRYHTRSLSSDLAAGRESVLGGGFEMDF